MFKIGTDIVLIPRIEKSISSERFLKSVYTQNEIKYCKSSASFAGIFAAKEALLKALGTGIKGKLSDYEVLHDELGKPYFNGVGNCDVSISHDGDYAVASVILWGENL